MRNELTSILMILDRSGSMSPLADDVVGGYNSFIAQQKAEPGDAVVTLVLFDHNYEVVYDARPIARVEPLTKKVYSPGGTTALLDAVGRGVQDLGTKLAAMEESDRLGKVIVVIMTDGQENASSDFTRDQVKKLVADQKTNGWSFLFMGANMDAFAEAKKIGIERSCTASWVSTGAGVRHSLGLISGCVAAFRTGNWRGFGN